MKKLFIIFLCAYSLGLYCQTIQLSNCNNHVPRISWSIGKIDTLHNNIYGGIYIANQGSIWKDSIKHKYRTIMIQPILLYKLGFIKLGCGLGFNLNTKEKYFTDKKYKNSYWFDNRVLNPSLLAILYANNNTGISLEYFIIPNKYNQRMFNIGLIYKLKY